MINESDPDIIMKLGSINKLFAWLWTTWKGYRTQAVLNAVIGLSVVAADLAFVWITKLTVDIATHVNRDFGLRQAFAMLCCIVVLQVGLGIASRWVRATLGIEAQNRMRRKLFARLLNCEWKKLKKYHTGNLLNRIERDVRDVISFLTEDIPSFVTTCAQFLGAFIFLFWMDRTLACIIVLVIPFFVICSKLYIRKMRSLTHEIRESESRIQATIQESLQHSLVIKTLERTGTMCEKLSGLQRRLRGEVIVKTKYSTVSSTLMNIGFASGYLVTFIWGVTNLEKGLITYGALIAFIQLVGQIQGPVRTLTKFVPVFISTFTATERLMELEEIPVEKTNEPVPEFAGTVGIDISRLTFSYTPDSRYIFNNFNFDFPPGSITAILGETGSGKTTLIRLLLALARPCEGWVTLYDEKGLRTPVSPAARSVFSYVPQGNTLISGTIRENLLLGNPDATEQQMAEALRNAAAEFVFLLPQNLDTVCGEMGDGLSEGQAQRIAIARALLKESPVLLLDEATSSLDAETERRVISNIISAYGYRTILFVTHRPEVLKYCTQTLRLEKNIRMLGNAHL